MQHWIRRIASELDLGINDESELRGLIKGLALGLVIYLGLPILVLLAYQRMQGG